ncbi:MAG: Competence protein ComEC, partial [Modestobacter sp.]|nr:Competence protein ComEC [Modestobacter sp.]
MRVRRRVTADRWSWIDLRLVPAAVTVWTLSLVTRGWAPAQLVVTGVAGAVAGALLLRGNAAAPPRRRAARAVAVGCLA